MTDLTEKNHSYDFFTFLSRIYNKLLFFVHGIRTNGRAPMKLKSNLYSVVRVVYITIESIKLEPLHHLEPTFKINPTSNISFPNRTNSRWL